MKTSDSQELKPVYIHETGYSTHDEISLIDLAMVLVRRRWMIAVISTIIITLGITAVVLKPKLYSYRSTIEMGSQVINGSIETFEAPQSLLSKLKHGYIPQVLFEHQHKNTDDKKTYKVDVDNPKHSSIILLEISGTEERSETLKWILQNITKKAVEDHSRIYDSVKKNIDLRLSQANTRVETLKSTHDSTKDVEIAIHQASIETLSSQLANLRNTREILPPIKSIKPIGSNKRNIIIVTAIAGIFLSVFIAFLAEFISKVKIASMQTSTGKN